MFPTRKKEKKKKRTQQIFLNSKNWPNNNKRIAAPVNDTGPALKAV